MNTKDNSTTAEKPQTPLLDLVPLVLRDELKEEIRKLLAFEAKGKEEAKKYVPIKK